MARLKVSILLCSTFLLIFGVGFLSLQGWSAEAARSALSMNQAGPTPTPTPITGIHPPDFPSCPNGFELMGTFDDYIRRDIEPRSQSYPFSLPEEVSILLQGWVMEGHPDLGCPGHPDCDDVQDHEDIIFELDGDILGIYEDSEHGPYENAWYFFGPMTTDLLSGSHLLTFRHTLYGDGAQSVGYRFSLCGQMEASPTNTDVPEITSTFTPSPSPGPTDTPGIMPTFTSSPSPIQTDTPEITPTFTPSLPASPTDEPSITPTLELTPNPTNTPLPVSGLVAFGNVQVDNAAHVLYEQGLAGVEIHLAFASYPGNIVAMTDDGGNYKSDFIHIPVDETIRVWAVKEGYRLEPEQEVWRFYGGHYQERRIDFLAYSDSVTVTPITPTFTPTFTPTATPGPAEPNCQLPPVPRAPQGYFRFDEVGKIYPTDGIFNVQAGTVSTWVCLEPNHYRDDHIIFHTSDSRFILYFDTYFSSSMKVEISRFVARGGGTHRAIDSGYTNGNFPEASIIMDNNGSLREYGANTDWYSSVPFREGEWHLVTMTWEGYPSGLVKIFLDGGLIGKKPYDERYNDDRPLADAIAIGFRPIEWPWETYVAQEQQASQLVPTAVMSIQGAGIQLSDLRLYKHSLSRDEIMAIFLEVRPYP
jgi:hypothetical protein